MFMREVLLNDADIKGQNWKGIKTALPIVQDKASEAVEKYIVDKAYFDFNNSKSNQIAPYDILNKQMRNIPAPTESELAITMQKAIDALNKFNATIHMANRYLELKSIDIPKKRQAFVQEQAKVFEGVSKKLDDPRIITKFVIEAGTEDVAKKTKVKHSSKKPDNTFENVKAMLGGVGHNIQQGKDILNMGVETIRGGGSISQLIGQTEAIMDDQSKVHLAVLDLRNQINTIYGINRSHKIPADTRIAAVELVTRLDELLTVDKANPASRKDAHQFNLAKASIDIIDEFRPRLESAPGFWNQLKAKINIFVENVFGIKNCLGPTDGTVYSGSKGIQSFKNAIAELKDKHDPDLQMEDHSIQPKR